MNTLAFDLATRSAWAEVAIREHKRADEPDYEVLSFGVINVSDFTQRPEALSRFQRCLEIVLQYGPTETITYERVPATWRGAKQIALQHEQYGVFLCTIGNLKVAAPVYSFSPSDWQLPLLGIRSNTKLLKAHAITQARLRAGFVTNDTDLADAVNIGIYGLIKARQAAAIGASV